MESAGNSTRAFQAPNPYVPLFAYLLLKQLTNRLNYIFHLRRDGLSNDGE